MWDILLSVIAGLVLFLFAITSLSETIQKAIGENAKKWILRFTSNTFKSILTGIIITILLGSSSAVIIITIVFVNAQSLTFRQAMGIVLGANIGTTFNSQLIALHIGKFSPILLLVGFILFFAFNSENIKNIGKIMLYLGMLFFGLYTIEQALDPLKEQPYFIDLLKMVENPLPGALAGTLVTLAIHSSSATIGMAIILAKKGLLGLSGGMAIMLGAELGTCSDTLLSTIKGSRQAIKTGLFHLLFNLLSIILGLILFYPFLHFIEYIGQHSSLEQSIANAHMIFNIGGVLIFVWFLPLFEKVLNKLIPEKTISNNEKN